MDINQKSINHIQALSARMIMEANSGHTGVALGGATIFYALFKDHLRFDKNAENINRDRFVVSAGHASALYYSTLYAFGYDLTLDDLKKFRQINSKTPGHPEIQSFKGVDCSTGPLGQGVANAVGLAIASKHYAHTFNVQNFNIINNKVYCFAGDGCLMEGVALEAISLAGTLKLDNLILLYDCNNITIDGNLTQANAEDIKTKFISQGWEVVEVKNGNNYKTVTTAIKKAKKLLGKPVVVIFKTKIGHNSVYENQAQIHGKPLKQDEYNRLIEKLEVNNDFCLPYEVLENCQTTTKINQEYFEEWNKKFVLYENTHPELFKHFCQYKSQPNFAKEKFDKLFEKTRYSGRDANAILFKEVSSKIPSFLGGCADVANSTKVVADGKFMSSEDYRPKNIYFGVREHAMGAVCNGISLFDNTRSFCSTFLAFANYLYPAIRMACLMNLPVMYFFTHDSIYVGEDGPTHQPIEQISQLRQFPGLKVYRPCDCFELIECYKQALNYNGPSAFILSRNNQNIYSNLQDKGNSGAKILCNQQKADITILSSGTDVELCFQAKKILDKNNIKTNIVSIPCFSDFDSLKANIKNNILKGQIFAVEASNDTCWYKYTTNVFNLNTFGKSGKGEDVARFMGWTPVKLARYIKNTMHNK